MPLLRLYLNVFCPASWLLLVTSMEMFQHHLFLKRLTSFISIVLFYMYVFIISVCACFLPSEADQRSHNEGEHENWEPSCQHEEEPCASDHSV